MPDLSEHSLEEKVQEIEQRIRTSKANWRKWHITIDWPWPEDEYHYGRLNYWSFGVRWLWVPYMRTISFDFGPLLGIYIEFEEKT